MMPTQVSDSAIRILAGREEEKLLSTFFVLYKNARIVEGNNPTFQSQLSGFFSLLTSLSKEVGDISLKACGGRYFINEKLVRFDDKGLSGAARIIEEWTSLGLGGVQFAERISEEDVKQFVLFMSKVKPNSENLDSLSDHLQKHQLSGIKLLSVKEVEAERPEIPAEVRQRFRVAARTTFFKAMVVVEEVMVNTLLERDVNISKTKRVVHSLIDHITRDESSLIELSAIKDHDDYTYAHSTNVCVYALTLGIRLGLDRARLSQLGFAALFHDVGKVKLPADLIKKPEAYDENDWIQMQLHPILGAKTILRNMKHDSHSARAARAAFEHHINADLTGYPMLRDKSRATNLFSQVISIVDTFDALSSGRVYIKKAISPDKVLAKMHYQMNQKFDPFLLKIFNNIIGIYPPGSLVFLTTDEIALVLTNNDVEKDCPCVKIVGNRDGLLKDAAWADLSQPGEKHRKIVRLVDPSRYGLDAKDFILDS